MQNAAWPHFTNDPACTGYILQAINNARAIEGVKPMVLPSNWFSLSTLSSCSWSPTSSALTEGFPRTSASTLP